MAPRSPSRHRRSRARRFVRLGSLLLIAGLLLTAAPVVYLRYLPAPTSSFMLQRRAEARAEGRSDFELRYRWAEFANISPAMGLAVMSAEDQRFATHHGFDTRAIRHALADRLRGRPLRGASTLSQQVAKNLFLWPGKSFVRKALEAYFTVLIEGLWPKRRILEMYLNIAELGDGVFGVQAAARVYFGRSASKLTSAQAALLAAVLPNPRIYHVADPSPRVREKQRWIMQQMHYHRSVGTLVQL